MYDAINISQSESCVSFIYQFTCDVVEPVRNMLDIRLESYWIHWLSVNGVNTEPCVLRYDFVFNWSSRWRFNTTVTQNVICPFLSDGEYRLFYVSTSC